jgi:hypothetical protein
LNPDTVPCVIEASSVDELVGHHHAWEADDREAIADLELARVAEGQGGEIGRFDAQQREVAPRHRLPRDRRAVLGDLGRQALAIGQDHPDRRSQLDVVR